MPKNQLLENYPELWAVRGDWDEIERIISTTHVSEHQLLRKPQAAEELWVRMTSHTECDGKIVQVPWKQDETMAIAAARAIPPRYRAQWLATVSEGGKKIAVLFGTGNDISVQERILVCAYQIPLFPDPDIVIGKIVDAA